MQPVVVSKNLIAASSTGLGTFSSAGTVTLNTSSVGTGRRIIIWGSTGTGTSIRIVGTNEFGTPIGETISGSSIGTAVATTQDFLTLTSVSVTGTINSTTGYIGTNTQGGTPWQAVNSYVTPINLGFNVTPTTTAVIASLEYTFDYPAYSSVAFWNAPNPLVGPPAFISTACSSVTAAANGNINIPVSAWRITLTSTSSGAGSANATVLQAG